jgi:hypothetical protein
MSIFMFFIDFLNMTQQTSTFHCGAGILDNLEKLGVEELCRKSPDELLAMHRQGHAIEIGPLPEFSDTFTWPEPITPTTRARSEIFDEIAARNPQIPNFNAHLLENDNLDAVVEHAKKMPTNKLILLSELMTPTTAHAQLLFHAPGAKLPEGKEFIFFNSQNARDSRTTRSQHVVQLVPPGHVVQHPDFNSCTAWTTYAAAKLLQNQNPLENMVVIPYKEENARKDELLENERRLLNGLVQMYPIRPRRRPLFN